MFNLSDAGSGHRRNLADGTEPEVIRTRHGNRGLFEYQHGELQLRLVKFFKNSVNDPQFELNFPLKPFLKLKKRHFNLLKIFLLPL